MTRIKLDALKVLVVDDHADVRVTILRNLKNIGFKLFDQAANVDEAIAKVENSHYNIVFLDVHMPGKTGYSLLEKCRADRKFSDTAFVIISSDSEKSAVIEALKAGANAFIVKPIEDNSFKEYVNKMVVWLGQRIA